MNISQDISSVKGVGPKLTERLNKCGIFTILDLLLYFPRDYEFIRGNIDFQEIDENEKQILTCRVVEFGRDVRTKTGKIISTIIFDYRGYVVEGKWFNQKYIKASYRIGGVYDLVGKFKKVGNRLEIINPINGYKDAKENEIIPKYPLKGDLSDRIITKLINQILQEIIITENLPKYIIEKYKLTSLDEAIRNIHFPKGKNELDKAIIRLKFQELFTYSMKLLLLKNKLRGSEGINFQWVEELRELKASLPFSLTDAQTKVVREILRDQKSMYSMNRLVQGDVGSGKTIVALIAIFNVIKNGYQASLMVPTEILANQHYAEAKKLFMGFDVDVELLTGSTTLKEKRRIKEKISSDKAFLVIGTHALIQEDVEFKNLGLVVTDEQHRFGVEQRSKLINKGRRPDVLVMTATPIPRTLALYLYSDLDVSIIDKLPPGRKKIDTKFFNEEKRYLAYDLALKEVNKGRQVYIVCPLIEDDEKMQLNSVEKLFSELKNGVFENIPIEILHGKMKAQEKDGIITAFKDNKIKVIISTTVIEVGVNVPNASVMIIENAERFGLAQLHQLRGRVGRGEYESYCVLIGKAKSNNTKKRMEIMTESTDGFYISEQDLKLRGSGEMFGLKQSGAEGLILADIYEDIDILRCARGEANMLIKSKESDAIKVCREIANSIERWSRYICFN
ncbi:ATP-dependent DNA helicase RecG [Clostridium chauvoei]|uniref:ATP-dependent DNA helicase RecG n=2 Tax=Clostridium chauvoei TaxID=46867 RepID=S6F954_9CLOT|nr:ATP-dependent DNA helicase RecG [Clostridium chauvoei]ATD54927.1 ATP-dependent DNA helicase RecG [Clostridium chauvoei]ATD57394.1 ATP-dependent DNA helicase RecG [Clostridium chauvoei]MBX7280458.1 ATP-dependent DNA helicase RecG [Clostridium chauvoei]MBX7282943.1 ATP-dependent DNA helicase RecG [Clostridium chauvoei]MBX7285460.1 ATP-dependent DNA helicase RecG [Clostridium chauvoei]